MGVPGGFTLDGGSGSFQMPGTAVAFESGVGFHEGACYAGDAADNTVSTRIVFGNATVTATVPFTWGTGDELWLFGVSKIV